jgi:hypothetical protein
MLQGWIPIIIAHFDNEGVLLAGLFAAVPLNHSHDQDRKEQYCDSSADRNNDFQRLPLGWTLIRLPKKKRSADLPMITAT